MSYRVRNPNRKALGVDDRRDLSLSEQQEQHHGHRQKGTTTLEQKLQWTFVGVKRVSNSNDENDDENSNSNSNENGNYFSVVQKDEAAFMALPTSNEPLITYSTRAPNYPIGYSCEHTLFYSNDDDKILYSNDRTNNNNNNNNNNNADVAIYDASNLSYSEDENHDDDYEKKAIVLNQTLVPIVLEFRIPDDYDYDEDYDRVTSNVEALQWSILNEVAKRSGLAKGCKVDAQYDQQTLLTALTTMDDMQASSSLEVAPSAAAVAAAASASQSSSSSNGIGSGSGSGQEEYSLLPVTSSSTSTQYGYRNRRRNRKPTLSRNPNPILNQSNGLRNRRRARTLGTTNGHLILSLPYPTSVYSVDSTRPKWTASCSSEMMSSKEIGNDQCFTAQISLDIKYRGSTEESNLIEEFIQSIVHNQIALDPTKLFAEDITGLKWISNEEASSVLDESNGGSSSDQEFTPSKIPIYFGPEFDNDNNNDNDNTHPGGHNNTIATQTEENFVTRFASIIFPIATIFILSLVWCFTHRHYSRKRKSQRSANKKKQKNILGLNGPNQLLPDIETGSLATEMTQSTRDLISKTSSDISDNPKQAITAAVSTALTASSPPSLSPPPPPPFPPPPVSKRRKKSIPISVDSPERSAAGLPPRPMVAKRAISKQLKNQRRKKKRRKNKVMALQRIKSRDNIIELPMISESESECDSESGGEDDEYYQDDDTISYDASVVCSTPTRLSRTSSRASITSSPPKSPRDEPFPTESTTDVPGQYEFIMEAPEFSKDVFAELLEEKGNDASANTNYEEHLPPKVALQPKITILKTDAGDENGQTNNGIDVSMDGDREREHLEIEPRIELDNSFTEENVSVMERMMPLPWLASSRNIRMW